MAAKVNLTVKKKLCLLWVEPILAGTHFAVVPLFDLHSAFSIYTGCCVDDAISGRWTHFPQYDEVKYELYKKCKMFTPWFMASIHTGNGNLKGVSMPQTQMLVIDLK